MEQDPRFTINRFNSTTIEVTAPHGLRGDEEVVHLAYALILFWGLSSKLNVYFLCLFFRCVTDVGLRENVTIFIDDMCKPNAMQCHDGRCRPIGDFCDRKPDCVDGSDELKQFCDGKNHNFQSFISTILTSEPVNSES